MAAETEQIMLELELIRITAKHERETSKENVCATTETTETEAG